MSHFYGTLVAPGRAPLTRCGHKPRGIEATVQSWEHIFLLEAYHSTIDGDSLRILYAPKGDSAFPSHRIVLLDEPMARLAESCGSLPGRLTIRA